MLLLQAAENGLSYKFISPKEVSEEYKKDIDFFWPKEVFQDEVDVIHTTYDGLVSYEGIRCFVGSFHVFSSLG